MTRTILVVDDERDLAATCERLLSRRGWRVVTAGTCEGALAALGADPRPALAIVDRRLPDGDGIEILRAAAAVGTPVIIATGYGTAATRKLTLGEGAAGFLAKPFSARELLELVGTIVGDPHPGAPPPPPRPATGDQPRPGLGC